MGYNTASVAGQRVVGGQQRDQVPAEALVEGGSGRGAGGRGCWWIVHRRDRSRIVERGSNPSGRQGRSRIDERAVPRQDARAKAGTVRRPENFDSRNSSIATIAEQGGVVRARRGGDE